MRSNGYVVTYLWLRRIKRPHRREEREKGKAYKKWLRVEKQGRINDYSGHLSGGNDGETCRGFEQVSASKKTKKKTKKKQKKKKKKTKTKQKKQTRPDTRQQRRGRLGRGSTAKAARNLKM